MDASPLFGTMALLAILHFGHAKLPRSLVPNVLRFRCHLTTIAAALFATKMPLTLLNLHEPTPTYPRLPLSPRPFRLDSANVSRGVVPRRGLLYSFLVHEVAIFAVLFFPSLDNFRTPPLPPRDRLFAIDLNSRAKLIYFPPLNPQDDGGRKSRDKKKDLSAKPPA